MPEKDKKMETLDRFLNAMNGDAVTMSEFKKSFIAIIKQILAFEKKMMAQSQTAMDEVKQMLGRVASGVESRLTAKIDTLQNGLNGKDGRDGIDGKDGRWGKDGKNGSPDTGKEIIKKINADKDNLIKREKIAGLDKLEERIKSAEANSAWRGGGGSFNYNYDISELLDGSTKTFTLPQNAKVLLVICSSSPFIFRPTTDYTATASTLTFTDEINASTTLATGQTVIILYKIL